MIRLLLVELSRLASRRAVLLLVTAAVVIPLAIGGGMVLTTAPPGAEELATAQQQADDEAQRPYIKREIGRCVNTPARYGLGSARGQSNAELQASCAERVRPRAEDFAEFSNLDLETEINGSGMAVVALVAVVLFLSGATFAGHDWNTGSMSNQLLFEPRRLRVWAAKAAAITSLSLLVAGVVTTAYWLGLDAVLHQRGMPPGPGVLVDALQAGWRGAGFAAAAALGGYALTMLSRSTVFSIGMLFAVSAVGGLLLAAVGPDDTGNLDPTINAAAIIKDGTTYVVDVPDSCFNSATGAFSQTGECNPNRTRSIGGGLTYYGTVLGAAMVLSVGSFRRRDVP